MRPMAKPSEAHSAEGGAPAGVRSALRAPRSPFLKYWRIFGTSLIERMTYRADFFISTVLRFLPMITTILLWQAIYLGSDPIPDKQKRLSGFSFEEMIAYL